MVATEKVGDVNNLRGMSASSPMSLSETMKAMMPSAPAM